MTGKLPPRVTGGTLAADHHDFIDAASKTDVDLEAEVKALEQRRDELEAELAAIIINEANQKLADELRQQVENLENELAQSQSSKE
ncbi:MAG: hypothetical protein Q8R82_07105 [Hyphomonadaceae bacterium]|nr:hypothetical protein [Hyphomonadaceae bacterium]